MPHLSLDWVEVGKLVAAFIRLVLERGDGEGPQIEQLSVRRM